jgi:penicillin-binding protein 1A
MLETAVADVLAASPPTSLPWLLLREDWYKLEMALAQLLVHKGHLRRKLPPVVLQALIAGEDHRFLDHRGIDFWAVARALFGLVSGQRLGGGSTIEQQLYRTLTDRRERTMTRKARELLGARFLGGLIDKESIASSYLAVAYFGAYMNGIEQACTRLKLDLAAMTADEAAALIARLKYPEPRHASAARVEQIARRAAWIRQRMTQRSPHAAHAHPSRP